MKGSGKSPDIRSDIIPILYVKWDVRAGEYAEKLVKGLAIIKVEIESMTGKSQGIDGLSRTFRRS
jgi:hypothetical protein